MKILIYDSLQTRQNKIANILCVNYDIWIKQNAEIVSFLGNEENKEVNSQFNIALIHGGDWNGLLELSGISVTYKVFYGGYGCNDNRITMNDNSFLVKTPIPNENRLPDNDTFTEIVKWIEAGANEPICKHLCESLKPLELALNLLHNIYIGKPKEDKKNDNQDVVKVGFETPENKELREKTKTAYKKLIDAMNGNPYNHNYQDELATFRNELLKEALTQ